MCGICGIVEENSSLDSLNEDIDRMLSSIYHRGPDEKDKYINKTVGLGCYRLSIIDLAAGTQPISNEDGSLWIVFNGEIYNFKELKIELTNKGHVFKTNTDTEVILHLYEEEQEDCLNKLNGMFAIAIWDEKNRLLFIARDRFGIKPLYYSINKEKFIFASEIKSFLSLQWFPRKLDYVALDKYLSFEYIPSPYSIFKDIKKLSSGHYLKFKNNEIIIKKYWDIRFKQSISGYKNEYKEKFLYLLNDSVSKRMFADVPVGLYLSGGIDSSTIGYFMIKNSSSTLNTYSIDFKEPSFDESFYSNIFADKFNTEHRNELFDIDTFISLVPDVIRFLDEPLADPSLIPTYFLSKFSSRVSKVVLSGEGGDEIFLGYPTYFAHKVANIYTKLPMTISKNVNKLAEKLPVSMENLSLDYKIKKFISGLNFPPYERNIIWMGAFLPEEKNKLYNSEFTQFIKKFPTFDILKSIIGNCNSDNFLDTVQYLNIKTYLMDNLLMKVDRASMVNSQEVRVPFLDHRLVEFVCNLPEQAKLEKFVTKYLLKNTMKKVLPKNIVYRKKKGFGIPISFWIKSKLKNDFLKLIHDSAIKDLGIFNMDYVKFLLWQHLENKKDNRKQLWSLFILNHWCEKWLK